MSYAERFMRTFEGSNTAHGQTQIGNTRRNGKTEAKSFVVREPLTLELITAHLNGESGVGSIPINSENTCRFAALDIDTYPIDHAAIVRKVEKFDLPIAVCRSKSGGAHLYMFFEEWFPASEIREYLIEISAILGYSGCEIFPKQDKILADRGDVGNFINLPYFDAEQTMRYMVNAEGDPVELADFLDWVDAYRTKLTDLDHFLARPKEAPFSDAPPCLETMLNNGIPEGTRNTTLFQTGVYCKKKFPDGWQAEVEAINQQHFKPSLGAIEVVQVQEQHEKKQYGYLCTQEPFKSYCNKGLCRNRKYGIGQSGTVDMPSISGLTILLSEPRLYFLDVDGKRLELSTEQLQMPIQFQRQCMEQLNYMPPTPKPADWQILVNELLKGASQIEVPEELTVGGQFKELLRQFCTSRIRAMSPEEIELKRPWTEDEKTYFKIAGLQEFLVNQGFTKLTRPQIQERLKELNNGQECHGFFKYKDEKNAWKNTRVWWVPEFTEEEVELPEGEKYEAPF